MSHDRFFLPTHVCLDQLRTLVSYLGDKTKDVDLLLQVHHVNHAVDDDEGACSAYASAVEECVSKVT